MKNNKTAKAGILAVVLLLAVAFAAVTTQLNIGGTAKVGSNSKDFEDNIVFSKAESKTAYLMIGDEQQEVTYKNGDKSISFDVGTFTDKGDEAVLHYWVENKSTNYAAELAALNCEITSKDNAPTDYLELTIGTEHDGVTVGTSSITDKDNTVVIKLAKTYVEQDDAEYSITCTIDATSVGQDA